TTMDTGEGGVNDNVFYMNDFSFAPANGIEATFSRNSFARNYVEGCEYGMWGGYSYSTRIVGNRFLDNRTGIAIEHGQNDTIVAARPRSAIIIDEWGPYDYRSPRLWPVDSTRENPLRLRTLGPRGRWRVAGRRGIASLSAESGAIGDTITVTPKPDSIGDWEL